MTPFITIFTAPKPFTDPHIAIIQQNAIRSWLHLGEDVEVLLIGDETGIAEEAVQMNLTHLPEVARNEWGTPLVSSIFHLARIASRSPLLAYVNADILLTPAFVNAARAVHSQAERFLIVGQRWDLDVHERLDFTPNWTQTLQKLIRREGTVHPPVGSDYFIFPRFLFQDMPDFAIGRAGWDNWMIFHACKQRWTVVDATPDVTIVHQNHDYNHLPGGKLHYDLEESRHNIALARNTEKDYTGYMVLDTNKELRKGRLVSPHPSLLRLVRQVEVLLMPREKQGFRWGMVRKLRRIRRRLTET